MDDRSEQSEHTNMATSVSGAALKIGEIYQESASVISSNAHSFVTVAFIFSLPGLILDILLSLQQRLVQPQLGTLKNSDPSQLLEQFPVDTMLAGLVSIFLQVLIVYVAMGALMYASIEHLAGRRATLGTIINHAMSSARSVSAIAIANSLIVVTATLPGLIFGTVAGGTVGIVLMTYGSGGNPESAVLAILCCVCSCTSIFVIGPVAYVITAFLLAVPSAIVEQAGVVHAMRRSFDLTRGRKRPIAGALLFIVLTFLLLYIFRICIAAATGMAGFDMATMAVTRPSFVVIVINALLGLVSSMFLIMVTSPVAAVIYARIRGIRDGIDADSIAQVFR